MCDKMDSNKYLYHFNHTNQKGGVVPRVFSGKHVMSGYGFGAQQGGGIGQLLGSVFRTLVPVIKSSVLPVVKRAAKTTTRELTKSGVNILKCVALDENPQTSAKNELQRLKRRAAIETIKELERNSAKKPRKASKVGHATKSKKRKRRATSKAQNDIFG